MASQEAIRAIRMRAELARRISRETGHPLAKAELLEIAARLDAEADRIDTSAAMPPSEAGDD